MLSVAQSDASRELIRSLLAQTRDDASKAELNALLWQPRLSSLDLVRLAAVTKRHPHPFPTPLTSLMVDVQIATCKRISTKVPSYARLSHPSTDART